MHVGLLSDIHGNRVALDAVLEDMPPVDTLVCAGDVVGYNPWPGACVDALRTGEALRAVTGLDDPDPAVVPTVMGNHDRAVVEDAPFRFNRMARAGVNHATTALDHAQLEWLAGLPTERTAVDGRVRIVHGHPDDPDRYTPPEEFSPSLLADEDVLVMGHTHVQHAERYDERLVVNPGSVGQPRDGDPRAAYAVVDMETMTVALRRVEYDVEAVQHAVSDADLPEETASRLAVGR